VAPPTSGVNAWSTDSFNSAIGLNLVTQADSTKVFYGPVADTTATTIVFDATTMFNASDAVAGTAADWGVGTTYNFRVMAPDSVYAWGNWLGEVKGIKLNVKETLRHSSATYPLLPKRQDTKESDMSLKEKHFTPNKGVFAPS